MNHIALPLTSKVMRMDLFTYFPLLQTKPLKQFLKDVFACDEMVQAYLTPMRNQPPHAPRIVLAVDVATAVAREVRHSAWSKYARAGACDRGSASEALRALPCRPAPATRQLQGSIASTDICS